MSVLAVAGRFKIEICDVRTPEAAEQNTQVAGCIQEIVDQEFRLVEDITRLRWSLLAYERSDHPLDSSSATYGRKRRGSTAGSPS